MDDLLKKNKEKSYCVAAAELGQDLFHIFIWPKSDGSFRLILNLSN